MPTIRLNSGGVGGAVGAAGGDLSGTYPNPEVIAFQETGGPTRLVFGAIAANQILQRVGATVVGLSPAGDFRNTYTDPIVWRLTGPATANETVQAKRAVGFDEEVTEGGTSGAISVQFGTVPKRRINLTGDAQITLAAPPDGRAFSGALLSIKANGNAVTSWTNVDWGSAGAPVLDDDEAQLSFYFRGTGVSSNWRGWFCGGGFS